MKIIITAFSRDKTADKIVSASVKGALNNEERHSHRVREIKE